MIKIQVSRASMIATIRMIRTFTGCGLREAKDMYDRATDRSGNGLIHIDVPLWMTPEVTAQLISKARQEGVDATYTGKMAEQMLYKLGELVYDYTSNGVYAREILDPAGNVICHVIETNTCTKPAEDLIALLNRS